MLHQDKTRDLQAFLLLRASISLINTHAEPPVVRLRSRKTPIETPLEWLKVKVYPGGLCVRVGDAAK